MLGSRIRMALGAVTVTMLAVALVAPVSASQGHGHAKGHTRKAAMQTCKKGGWRDVEKADGTRFKNQGRCVSYVVRGGVVTPIEEAVTITFALATDLVSCDATGSVEDLGANQTYTGNLLVASLPSQVSVTTDASGEGTVALGNVLTGQVLNLTVNGVSSGDVVADCGVIVPPPPPAPI